jgi:outer membrane protein assembly factor BamB
MASYIRTGQQDILYGNSTLGTLSTDGQRVYAVEDLAVPPPANANGPRLDGRADRATRHNSLLAIGLGTGKLLWEVGGPDDRAEWSQVFFLGPPLPLDGKLYVLAQKDGPQHGELRLVCLDPTRRFQRGSDLIAWSETLTRVPTKVQGSPARRTQAAHIASAGGILVCPTNAGTLLGVEVRTRKVKWSYPYREEKTPAPKAGWKVTAPLIHDGKVIFTAPDGDGVYCLELADGSELWKTKRGDDLYLAGVVAGKVVLVGTGACRALRWQDGREAWRLPTGLPSGQGVAGGNIYYLPLRAGVTSKKPEVCAIDVRRGIVFAHLPAPANALPGNLLFYEGNLLSQTVGGVTAYPLAKP